VGPPIGDLLVEQALMMDPVAIMPLRGKILNFASAGKDKLAQNQQLSGPRPGAWLRRTIVRRASPRSGELAISPLRFGG
jgi:hypothetical protein